MPFKDPLKAKENRRQYYLAHKSEWKGHCLRWKLANPEKFAEMRRGIKKRHYHNNLEVERARGRVRAAKRRADPVAGLRIRERQQKWYAEHRDESIKHAVEKQRANPEKRRAAYLRDREKILAKMKSYYEAHPDKAKQQRRQRNQARRKAPGKHNYSQWLARAEFYGWECAYCRTSLTDENAHRDHVIAIKRGGTNWAANIVPSCRGCNQHKGTKRWLPRQPRPHGPLPL